MSTKEVPSSGGEQVGLLNGELDDISRHIEAIENRLLAIEAGLRKTSDIPDGLVPIERPIQRRRKCVWCGVPVGGVILWPFNWPPPGFLVCDGSLIDAQLYPRLAQLYGTHLPDMRNVYPFGADQRKASPYNSPLQYFGSRPYWAFESMNFGHRHQEYGIPFVSGYGGEGVDVATGVELVLWWPHSNNNPYWDLRQPSMTWTFIVRAG